MSTREEIDEKKKIGYDVYGLSREYSVSVIYNLAVLKELADILIAALPTRILLEAALNQGSVHKAVKKVAGVFNVTEAAVADKLARQLDFKVEEYTEALRGEISGTSNRLSQRIRNKVETHALADFQKELDRIKNAYRNFSSVPVTPLTATSSSAAVPVQKAPAKPLTRIFHPGETIRVKKGYKPNDFAQGVVDEVIDVHDGTVLTDQRVTVTIGGAKKHYSAKVLAQWQGCQ